MEAYEYTTMAAFETDYWWFRALHALLEQTLRGLPLPPEPQILDMGCGTGGNLAHLKQTVDANLFGFDISAHAAAYWPARGLKRVALGSINEVPFAGERFDVAMAIDVLESDAVDLSSALAEACRVVKPGGYLVLNVPAYKWLRTEEHHRAVHASRRWTRTSAVAMLGGLPLKVERGTYHFASVFPAVALYRLGLRAGKQNAAQPHSELKPMNPAINRLLGGVMALERRALRHVDLPFGSSILIVARKV